MGLKNKKNQMIKIDEVNRAIPQAIESVRNFAVTDQGKKARISMRTLRFSDDAIWVDGDHIPVEDYTWKDLPADGSTNLGAAFTKLAEILRRENMPSRSYPPVIVLITDGYPTDEWEKGLTELMEQFWAKEAIRIGIALEGADEDILRAFIGEVEDADQKLVKINDEDLKSLANKITTVTTVYGIPREKKRDKLPPGYDTSDLEKGHHTDESDVKPVETESGSTESAKGVEDQVTEPGENPDTQPPETEVDPSETTSGSLPSKDTAETSDDKETESKKKSDIEEEVFLY